MTTPNIYIPEYAVNLKDRPQKIKLGLQGESGSFKTMSMLTAPNLIILDLDTNLRAVSGKDIPTIPLFSPSFLDTYAGGKFKKRSLIPEAPRDSYYYNRADALIHFLENEATKFTEEQTLGIDSWSAAQNAFRSWARHNPGEMLSKNGEFDGWVYYRLLLQYSINVLEAAKVLNCNLIVTFHEQQERDPKTKMPLDKLKPLQEGSFVNQVRSYFTDFFRCIIWKDKTINREGPTKQATTVMSAKDFRWQVQSDDYFTAVTRSIFPKDVIYVEPSWNIFSQYERKDEDAA